MKNLPQWDLKALLESPMFEPLHLALQRYGKADFPTLNDFNALLTAQPEIATQSGKLIRFVEQAQGRLGFEAQYEPRCYLSGEVQTRENNLHDLFNAFVWLTFPQSKAAINARHYAALTEADSPLQSQRGSVRDMVTLFDESGVVVPCADTRLAELFLDFKWKELFWLRREEVLTGMGFYIFGHGLHEKAMQPYVGITGQGLLVQVEADFFNLPMSIRLQHLDERVAAYINEPENCRNTHELSPVPLLGIPGWSTDNLQPTYYDNQNYFRTGRRGVSA